MSDSAFARRGTSQERAKPLSPAGLEHADWSRPCNFCRDDSISLDPTARTGSTTQSVTDTLQPQPFARSLDERSALEELEQLADKIQLSRRQREEKVAEFDAFVRAFRQDRYAASIAASERELRRAEDQPSAASAAIHASRAVMPTTEVAPVSSATAALPGPPASTPWSVTAASEPAFHAAPARPNRPRAAYIGVSLAALAVIIVGVMLWRSAGAPDRPATQSTPAVPAASPAQAPPTPSTPEVTAPAPAAAVPAGPPRALNIEFVTVRPVWARITVDGRRAMEREFTADQRFPFGADRAIVVRAGDAGAIRLIVDGKDLGVLGRDGQVFERVFTPR